MFKVSKGFTLIELLIVVAIIAILAAIAVPNFLEAQVRAKVSRTKADMRSTAVAIEAYTIDWNEVYPGRIAYETIAGQTLARTLGMDANADNNWLRDFDWFYAQAQLTTPVAYQTSVFPDVFRKQSAFARSGANYSPLDCSIPHFPFAYETLNYADPAPAGVSKCVNAGYRWLLISAGPMQNTGSYANPPSLIRGSKAGTDLHRDPYDPSNGTVSHGIIMRTNQGDFTVQRPDIFD